MPLTEMVTPSDAMAGRMFVASDVGGHRELVRHGETGFLFPAGDARRLADSIDGVLARTHEWPTLSAQARRFVETERTWARSVARYASLPRRLQTRERDAAFEARGYRAMCGIYGILQLGGMPRPRRRYVGWRG